VPHSKANIKFHKKKKVEIDMVIGSCRWLFRGGEQENTGTALCGSVFRPRALPGESAPTLHSANSFGLIRIPTDTDLLLFVLPALSSRTEKHGAAPARGTNARACGCAMCIV
jgi:hypothetical protein